jgi:hypothetical protein
VWSWNIPLSICKHCRWTEMPIAQSLFSTFRVQFTQIFHFPVCSVRIQDTLCWLDCHLCCKQNAVCAFEYCIHRSSICEFTGIVDLFGHLVHILTLA